MTKAFALANAHAEEVPQRDTGNTTFAQWDDASRASNIDDGFKAIRREHLKKYVTAAMGASLLILVVAMARFAIGGGGDAEADIEVGTSAATFAKMREVPAEIAALPREVSTLTARTQAALKIEQKREMHAAKHMTARSRYW